MHVAQIVAITASLIGAIIGLVYYLRLSSPNSNDDYLRSSTWTISIPDESVTQTWYINADEGKIKIVQRKEDEAAIAVQEFHSGTSYEYSIWDRGESTVPADFCDVTSAELLEEMGLGDECDVAKLQAALDDVTDVKTECNVNQTDVTTEDNTDYATDPNAFYEKIAEDSSGYILQIGGFAIQFSGNDPTAILDEDDNPIAIIESFVDGIPGDVTFDGCAVVADSEARMLEVEERELGFAEDISDTEWCGAGTNNCNTPCPGTPGTRGTLGDNMGCRRHDHGALHEAVNLRSLGWSCNWFLRLTGVCDIDVAVKLECKVDKDLIDYAESNAGKRAKWAIKATFGTEWYSLANHWGCSDYQVHDHTYWTEKCSWGWRGRSCRQVRNVISKGWKTKYGGSRYNGITDRGAGIYVDKCQNCAGDIF